MRDLACERDALGALQTHLTRQYGRPVHPQLPPSDLATYERRSAHRRQEGRAGGRFHAVCAFSNTFRPGHNFSSEVSLVLQLVRAGVRVEPFRSLDKRLIGDNQPDAYGWLQAVGQFPCASKLGTDRFGRRRHHPRRCATTAGEGCHRAARDIDDQRARRDQRRQLCITKLFE